MRADNYFKYTSPKAKAFLELEIFIWQKRELLKQRRSRFGHDRVLAALDAAQILKGVALGKAAPDALKQYESQYKLGKLHTLLGNLKPFFREFGRQVNYYKPKP